MAERKELMKVQFISDHSCGTYQIGEIDSLPDAMVQEHIDRFGEYGYEQLIKFFTRGIQQAANKIQNQRRANFGEACAEVKRP